MPSPCPCPCPCPCPDQRLIGSTAARQRPSPAYFARDLLERLHLAGVRASLGRVVQDELVEAERGVRSRQLVELVDGRNDRIDGRPEEDPPGVVPPGVPAGHLDHVHLVPHRLQNRLGGARPATRADGDPLVPIGGGEAEPRGRAGGHGQGERMLHRAGRARCFDGRVVLGAHGRRRRSRRGEHRPRESGGTPRSAPCARPAARAPARGPWRRVPRCPNRGPGRAARRSGRRARWRRDRASPGAGSSAWPPGCRGAGAWSPPPRRPAREPRRARGRQACRSSGCGRRSMPWRSRRRPPTPIGGGLRPTGRWGG